MIETRFTSKEVDILLILEGTYPFMHGGVASWVADLIQNMPEFTFGIVFLGAYENDYKKTAYELPDNITSLQLLYLFDKNPPAASEAGVKINQPMFDEIKNMHENFKQSHACPHGLEQPIPDIGLMIDPLLGVNYNQFLRSKAAWEYIIQQYEEHSTDPSFVNYFWNIRNMHAPLWNLGEILTELPKAKLIHTISTGYAGLLGAMIHQRFQYPLILSEHGLYSKERNIELLQSTILINLDPLITDKKTFTYQHELWLKFFESLARVCYLITSLFSSAQKQQIEAGADPTKTRVIPNGADLDYYKDIRRLGGSPPKIVCFVGRFVRMKNVKDFIRAVSLVVQEDPDIEAWIRIVGDPDVGYLRECKEFIQLLDIEDKIHFISEGNMKTILSQIGVLFLCSITEGMPLVILEAMAAGVPVISTDVGSCRELIEGKDEADRALGSCGAIVNIGDTG